MENTTKESKKHTSDPMITGDSVLPAEKSDIEVISKHDCDSVQSSMFEYVQTFDNIINNQGKCSEFLNREGVNEIELPTQYDDVSMMENSVENNSFDDLKDIKVEPNYVAVPSVDGYSQHSSSLGSKIAIIQQKFLITQSFKGKKLQDKQ